MGRLGLTKRKERRVLTWRGWLVVLTGLVLAAVIAVRMMHPFLATSDPRGGELLVVEGWLPDDALAIALREFRMGGYRLLVTMGGPVPLGYHYSGEKTYAALAATTLGLLGMDAARLVVVPAASATRDRTYMAAVALKAWLDSSSAMTGNEPVRTITVCSLGPHARRTRLLYERALGRSVAIGIIPLPDARYDAAAWWRTSDGVRIVTGEFIAYLYARFLFAR